MTNIPQDSPIYASNAFLVESYPEQNAAELTRFSMGSPSGKISSVMFVGEDAALFLAGFTDAMTKLSDADVESEYLNLYRPLMQSRYLQ